MFEVLLSGSHSEGADSGCESLVASLSVVMPLSGVAVVPSALCIGLGFYGECACRSVFLLLYVGPSEETLIPRVWQSVSSLGLEDTTVA